MLRGVQTLNAEDLTAIELAGRRCAVCRTGRRWRTFVVVRRDDAEPVVMCAACRARYEDAPPAPLGRAQVDTGSPPARPAEPTATTPEPRVAEREDRVKR